MSFINKLQEKEWLNEVVILIVASLFLGIILAIQFKWPIISIEPINILYSFFICLSLFVVFIGAQKLTAYFLDCTTRTKLISFRRYWFQPLSEHGKAILPFEFPAWLVLPILLAFVNIKWLAILNFDAEPKPTHVRRSWPNITESDIGKIAISGPLAVIALGIITKIISPTFTNFSFLCIWLAFLSLIPIGSGFKLLNSSRILWFFSFFFSIALLLLIRISNTFAIVFMSIIFAVLATLAYYILYEK
ncbi:MAG: hypothetical protein QXK80_03110 [Candidatus Pacearchaeota archaeon]